MDHLAGLDLAKYMDLTRRIAELDAERIVMLRAASPAQLGDVIEYRLGGPGGVKNVVRGRVNYVGISHGTVGKDGVTVTKPTWTLNVSRIKADGTRAAHANHVPPEDFVSLIELAPKSSNGD